MPTEGEPALLVSEMHAQIFDLDRCPVTLVFTYVDGDDPSGPLRSALAATGLTGSSLVGGEDSLWFGDVDLVRVTAPALRLQRASGVFDRLRAVKDGWEIEQLRRASLAHDAGYRRAVEVVRPGVTVARAGALIVEAMVEAGSEEPVISGAFHRLTDRPFAAGEIVDVDLFPGSCSGYRADTARNIFLGEPSPEARRLYDATLAAYDAAVAAVRPGVTAESVTSPVRTRCGRRATSRSGRSGTAWASATRTSRRCSNRATRTSSRRGWSSRSTPVRSSRGIRRFTSKTRSSSLRTAARP